MWLYSSQGTLLAVSALTLLGMVWLATGRHPLQQLWRAGSALAGDRRFLWGLAGIGLVLAANAVQTRWETLRPGLIRWDFTGEVARTGGGFLLLLQRLEWAPATQVLTFAYVVLFPLLGLTSLVVYAARRDRGALERLFIGFFTNYLVALPFYVIFPVREAWAASAGVRFLIPTVYPAFEAAYRPFSGLDNCFPSLHTSLALTFALVAWRSGYRRLGTLLSGAAGLVMLSTLYLGVHWPLDLMAGAVLAAVAAGYLPEVVLRPAGAGLQHWSWR